MNFAHTNCCAIQEITGLSHDGSAEESMLSFCKTNLSGQVKFKSANANQGTIYSFYLFTAAIDTSSYYGRKNYGPEFAAFIQEHKLGVVTPSPIVVNSAFHKDHSNQVWIWTPDLEAIKFWWEEKKAGNVKTLKEPNCPSCHAEMDVNGICSEGCDDDEYDSEDDADLDFLGDPEEPQVQPFVG